MNSEKLQLLGKLKQKQKSIKLAKSLIPIVGIFSLIFAIKVNDVIAKASEIKEVQDYLPLLSSLLTIFILGVLTCFALTIYYWNGNPELDALVKVLEESNDSNL
ncbi:MAG: hypothetical protein NE327_00225 [Lentisphaeraceae bacterium]|nr:hypothetical protein [Lentisphaeraceae bacterium]